MAGRQYGTQCPQRKPECVEDGTEARAASAWPGPLRHVQNWAVIEYARRVGYVADAWTLARTRHAGPAIVRQVGADFYAVVEGLLTGLLMAVGVLLTTTALGALIGGGVGALAGGVGAVPGAAAGAKIGLIVGNWILVWLGVGFLMVYLAEHVGAMGEKFKAGILGAWESRGSPAALDAAARQLADGIGLFFSLLLQALVAYLTHQAGQGKAAAALQTLRESVLFKRCPRLQAWLIENYPRLRAKYQKLTWEVLEEGPAVRGQISGGGFVAGTSIPEFLKIRVGKRVFEVNRSLVNKKGEYDPVTKHMAEHGDGHAGPWAKAAQTDFPISSLAAALDQAEAQLMFQAPSTRAKPVKLDHWELLIDTTVEPWRVFHANYTSAPKW